MSTLEEADNQINSISYRNDGLQFVTGGSDVTVRTYDSLTSKVTLQLKSTEEVVVSVAHSNRIFCTKFHPTDKNLLVSGGWDDTIKVKSKVLIKDLGSKIRTCNQIHIWTSYLWRIY